MNAIVTAEDRLRASRTMLAAAMDQHAAGRLDHAERNYLAVLSEGYRSTDILPLLAGIASVKGDLQAAVEHWTRLLALMPSHLAGWTERGALLHRLGRWSEAIESLKSAQQLAPDNPAILANLGVALLDGGHAGEALTVFRRSAELQPGNLLLHHQIRRTASTVVPFWHIPMLNDAPRNDAFQKAIELAVAKHGADASVLDIGAGSGLLSMMAARAGATSVVCCEHVGVIAETARTIIERNGYSDSIRVIGKKSDELCVGPDLPVRADILVSEILSSDLLAEGVLATFEDALGRLVNHDATIIPRAVTAKGCLVESAVLSRYAFVDDVSGFDVSPFSALASQRLPVHGKQTSWRRLSADQDLVHIDLTAKRHDASINVLPIQITSDGVAMGVMQWMFVDVADGISFANEPDECADGGWLQIVHTFARPIEVRAGETFQLIAGHDRTSLILMPAAESGA